MKIVVAPNKILNEPTQPVTKFDENLRRLVRKMEETLLNQHDPDGVGLSANQVGVNLRLAVVRLNPEETDSVPKLLAIANPHLLSQSEQTASGYEGCLSIPDRYGEVSRSELVTVQFQDLTGKTAEIKATGFLARIFQHEIDHLDGKLISEKISGKVYTEKELEERLRRSN